MCVGWWGWGSEFFFLFISLHPSILWVSVKQSESSLVSLRPKFDSRAVLKLRSQSCGPAGTILCRKHSPGVCDSVTRLSERMQDGTKFYQLWQKKVQTESSGGFGSTRYTFWNGSRPILPSEESKRVVGCLDAWEGETGFYKCVADVAPHYNCDDYWGGWNNHLTVGEILDYWNIFIIYGYIQTVPQAFYWWAGCLI